MVVEIPPEEALVGITGYSTEAPGFSGVFKKTPADFVVEEIPETPKIEENGKYTIVKVRLKNWDTNKFVLRLARDLGIYSDRITYAGTKDKFAVTVQNFCINSHIENLPEIPDVEYLETFRTNKMLRLGSLKGNRFTVTVQDLETDSRNFGDIFNEIEDAGGFPNYYGLQRFGSMRPITHIVGKHLLYGDFEGAVKEYICDPEVDTEDFRLHFSETGDAELALAEFPKNLAFERSLLQRLASGESYERALRAFPRNLTMLFVHAYQSYIFNIALSRRSEIVQDMKEVQLGDFVSPVDEYFNSAKGELFQCDRFNHEKLNRLSVENKVRPVIKLPGYETVLEDNSMDKIVKEILESQGVSLENFRVKGNRSVSSRGNYRIVSALPVGYGYEPPNKIKFSLGKGIYATVFLREFLKGQALS